MENVAEERVQRKLAATLVADVIGCSRLMRENEALNPNWRIVDLNPNDPAVNSALGTCLPLAGRPKKSLHQLNIGNPLNPRHPRINQLSAIRTRAHLDAEQDEEAAKLARRVIQRGKVYLNEHLVLASALGHLGRGKEAREVPDNHEEFRELRISDVVLCPWWQLCKDPEPNEHLFEGLRKVGVPE